MQTSVENHSDADSQLKSRIINCLHAKAVPEVASIQLDVRDGTVVIAGTVSQTSIKRHCYECCRHVAGVMKVIDKTDICTCRHEAHLKTEKGRVEANTLKVHEAGHPFHESLN